MRRRETYPSGRARYARGDHFVVSIGLRAVATKSRADQREERREAGIHTTMWSPPAQGAVVFYSLFATSSRRLASISPSTCVQSAGVVCRNSIAVGYHGVRFPIRPHRQSVTL
jgi:hypothetical protein